MAVAAKTTGKDAKKHEVIYAGLDRVLSGSISALRSLLNPSTLSEDLDISRDTAYRLFRERPDKASHSNSSSRNSSATDAIVREVTAASTHTEWSGYDNSFSRVGEAFQTAILNERPLQEAVTLAMAMNAQCQFESPGGPVGWVLHSAAITASPAWEGECTLSEEDKELGLEILAVRREFYQRMAGDLSQVMNAAMSVLGRRPRRGMDPNQLVALMHSFIDGAVLRRLIEPEVFDCLLIGEAAVALALAFSEEGALTDPRRPPTVDGGDVFDRMIEEASISWPLNRSTTVATIATSANVAPEAANILFPTEADLADSVVWSNVLGGGSLKTESVAEAEDGRGRPELAVLHGILRLTRDVADRLPGAVALVMTTPPTLGIGIREQLVREAAEILRRNVPKVNSRVTADDLVSAAMKGPAGWGSVTSMMRILTGWED